MIDIIIRPGLANPTSHGLSEAIQERVPSLRVRREKYSRGSLALLVGLVDPADETLVRQLYNDQVVE